MLNYCNIEISYDNGLGNALYNAAGKRVFEGTPYASTGSSDGSGAKIAERINAGALDHTYTFTFDAKGNMTSK